MRIGFDLDGIGGRMARAWSDERQVPAYRVGRVFLAGDAAHVRHRVGRAVLRSSGTLVRFAIAHTVRQRAARAVFRAMVSTVPPIRRRAVGMLTGIGFAYPAPRGAHRLTGKRAPDLPLAGGTRLYEALRARRFVLVTPSGATAPPDHRYESVEAADQGSGPHPCWSALTGTSRGPATGQSRPAPSRRRSLLPSGGSSSLQRRWWATTPCCHRRLGTRSKTRSCRPGSPSRR